MFIDSKTKCPKQNAYFFSQVYLRTDRIEYIYYFLWCMYTWRISTLWWWRRINNYIKVNMSKILWNQTWKKWIRNPWRQRLYNMCEYDENGRHWTFKVSTHVSSEMFIRMDKNKIELVSISKNYILFEGRLDSFVI